MISDDYHNMGRLLLLTIIPSSKNWTISIIVTENITVNRQNRLIVHPYTLPAICIFVFANTEIVALLERPDSIM